MVGSLGLGLPMVGWLRIWSLVGVPSLVVVNSDLLNTVIPLFDTGHGQIAAVTLINDLVNL